MGLGFLYKYGTLEPTEPREQRPSAGSWQPSPIPRRHMPGHWTEPGAATDQVPLALRTAEAGVPSASPAAAASAGASKPSRKSRSHTIRRYL